MSKARDIARAGTALANVDATELGYLDGVTSSVQTQLDAKAIPANVVNNSLVDAKGDILTATADNTPARLAVGSNGYTLVADSSTSTGLAYGSSALANPVINGGFDVWQRGTSISFPGSTSASSSTFTADRWQTATGTNQGVSVSRQPTGDTTNLPNIQYCARYQRNSGWTGTGTLSLLQNFESVNSIPFAGRTVTLSFYARAGANYSAASNGLRLYLISGTGTDQTMFSGFTNQTSVIDQTATLTTTWQRFSYSGTIATTATQLGIIAQWTPTGTAGANDYYEITGVQIDLGSTALPFRRSGNTLQGELAACQRYCVAYSYVTGSGSMYFASTTGGFYGDANQINMLYVQPVMNWRDPKSLTVTTVGTEGTDWAVMTTGGVAQTGFTLTAAGATINCTKTSHGLSGAALAIRSTSGRIIISSEL